jgi:hypothetical protein
VNERSTESGFAAAVVEAIEGAHYSRVYYKVGMGRAVLVLLYVGNIQCCKFVQPNGATTSSTLVSDVTPPSINIASMADVV